MKADRQYIDKVIALLFWSTLYK